MFPLVSGLMRILSTWHEYLQIIYKNPTDRYLNNLNISLVNLAKLVWDEQVQVKRIKFAGILII